MGALGNEGDGRLFLNTFKGKFTQRANEQTTGAVKRTNKNNIDIWELQFNSIADCFLQKIEKHDSKDYGFQWNIYLAHAKSAETFKLSLPYSGRMTMGLFLRLPKIDISKEMSFVLHYFPTDNKSALVIHQFGAKVEMFWTKDNPGDLPQLEETMKDGKPAWDSSKRMAYLEQYLDQKIHPNLMGIGAVAPTEQATTSNNKPSFPDSQGSATQDVTHQNQTVKAPAPVTKEIPEWDQNGGYLKLKHTDGKYYQCDENGTFKRDDGGKLMGILPF